MFVFRKIWRALFFRKNGFEICHFALLPMKYCKAIFKWTKHCLHYWDMPHLKYVALNVELLFVGLHLNNETSGYFCSSGKSQISFKKVDNKSVLEW